MISEDQYLEVLDYVWKNYPEAKEYWDENYVKKYQWKGGIPKAQVFIRLNPDISDDDATFIANGVRQFFKSRVDYLFTRK